MNSASMNREEFLDHLEQLFETHADGATGTEELSVAAHMLQTAAAAEAAGAPDSLIAAALLHDIGHWLDENFGDSAPDTDQHHENLGAAYLRPHFDVDVSRPVGLHVAAKRYLCAHEPSYMENISPASEHTLMLQGGPMNTSEMQAFERIAEHADAIKLRRWDEYGKNPDLQVAPFAHYRDLLNSLMVSA